MVFDWDNCKPWDSDLSKQQSKPQMIWLVFCHGHFICMFNTEWKTILQSPKRLWGNLLSLVPMVMSVKPYPGSRAEKSIPRPRQPLPERWVSSFLQDARSRYDYIAEQTFTCCWKAIWKPLSISFLPQGLERFLLLLLMAFRGRFGSLVVLEGDSFRWY